MHLLLPPWGCSDVALLLPSRTEVWGADFNHRHRANVVDLASGSVIWQFDLWHPKADRLLSTGALPSLFPMNALLLIRQSSEH